MIRYHCTSEFSEILLSFRLAFSKRSWPYLCATAIPWLVQSGQRHIRRLCWAASLKRHEASFYRFFSHFKFRTEVFFKALLTLIIQTFQLKELLIAVDDTLCPKWGKHIFGAGSFWDHTSRPRPGYIWGHNWVVLAVVVEVFGVPVALPFWVSLYRSKKHCPEAEFRTRLQIAIEALQKVQTWITLMISLVADGAYNNQAILKPLLKMKISLTSRLRFDAVLRRALPKRKKAKKRGRKPKYGSRLPSLTSIAQSGQGWKRIRVKIYGKLVTLNFKSFIAWWPKAGVQLQVVIVRDPKRRRKPTYLSSTDLNLKPVLLIQRFSRRWPIEQLFADVKTWLGLDSAEVRASGSVLRHAIFAFALVTWTRVWAWKHLSDHQNPPVSFLGQLSQLRTKLMAETIFSSIPAQRLSKRNCRDLASLMVN
jgi:hypothetical protein